jgi:hypothetical protein
VTITPRTVDNDYLFTVASSSVLLVNKVKPNVGGTWTIDSTFKQNVQLICNAQSDPEIALILSSARNKAGVYILGGRLTSRFVDEGDTRRSNLERVLYNSIFSPGLARISAILTAAILIGQIPLEGDLKFFSLSLQLREQALKELDMIIEQIAETPAEEAEKEERGSIYIGLNIDPLSAQNTQANPDLRPEYFTLSRSSQPVIGAKVFNGISLLPGESLTVEVFITSRGPNYGEFFNQVFTIAQNTSYPYILTNPALPFNSSNNLPVLDNKGKWLLNTQTLLVSPSDIAIAFSTQLNTLSLNTSDSGIANIMAASRSTGQKSFNWQRSLEQFWTDSNINVAVNFWHSVTGNITTVDSYLTSFDNANAANYELPAYGIIRTGSVVTDLMKLELAPRRLGGSSTSEMLSVYPFQINFSGNTIPAQSGGYLPAYTKAVPQLLLGINEDYSYLMHDRPISVLLGLESKDNEKVKELQYNTFYFNAITPTGSGTITYRITSQAEQGITYTTDTFTWGSKDSLFPKYNGQGEPNAARALWTHMSTRQRPISPELPNEDVIASFAHPHAIEIIAWRGSSIITPNFQVRVVVDILDLPAGLQVATGDINTVKPNSLWGPQASIAIEYEAKRMSIPGQEKGDDINELIKSPDVTAKAVKPRKPRSNKFQAALDRIERAEQRKNQYDLY